VVRGNDIVVVGEMGADADRFVVSMPVGGVTCVGGATFVGGATIVDEAQSKILFAQRANADMRVCSVSLPQSECRSLHWANPRLQAATQVRA
jgi:hypothetical protein